MALNDRSRRIGDQHQGSFHNETDAFAANDEGYRLLHNGQVEEGLSLLEASARAGVPWALATYSWHCLKTSQEARALALAQDALSACQAFAIRESSNPDLSRTAAYQVVNARSNLALCHLATGGDEGYALEAWASGSEIGHAESALYPAVLLWRQGHQPEADRLVERIPAPVRAGLAADMREGIDSSAPWFSDWCRDGMTLLDRAPQQELTADLIDLEGAAHLPRVGDPGVLPDHAWEALRLVHGDDSAAAETALRSLIGEGGDAAYPARMELGLLLVESEDIMSARYREGWDLLVQSLHAPFRDVIAGASWNIGAELQSRGDSATAADFAEVALALGDPTALQHFAREAIEADDDPAASELCQRIIDEVALGHPGRSLAFTYQALKASSGLPPAAQDWFRQAQGTAPASLLAQSAAVYLWKGHYNVDIAAASVSTRYFEACECYFDDPPELCLECGRSSSTTLSVASGAGDGAYPALELLSTVEGSDGGGVLTTFVQDNLPAVGMIGILAEFIDSAAPLIVGNLRCDGTLILADSSKSFDDRDVSISITQPPGDFLVVCWVGLTRSGTFAPVALGAITGATAGDVLENVFPVSDQQRSQITAEIWGDPGRLVHSLFADIRPPVAEGNADLMQGIDDTAFLSYVAQFGELMADDEAATWGHDQLPCGSEAVLAALEMRGYLEPRLPWWRPHMRNDPSDVWGRVLDARDESRAPGHDVGSDVVWVRRAAARSLHLSADQADTLARDPDTRVRQNLATNPVAPTSAIALLAGDSDGSVRRAVAGHHACPPETLRQFALSGWEVAQVAANPGTPLDVLASLAEQPDLSIRYGLARNPALPEALAGPLASDPEAGVRAALAENPATPRAIVDGLSLDADENVRQGAMGNPAASDQARAQASLLGATPPAPTAPAVPSTVSSLGVPRFCVMCGIALVPNANFCAGCGAAVVAVVATPQSSSNSAPDHLVEAALAGDQRARDDIIERVDLEAIRNCVELALQKRDVDAAEFWALEWATVPIPATSADQLDGLAALCEQLLVPQGRYEEASLYCSWFLTHPDTALRSRSRTLEALIDQARRNKGSQRLEHHGDWQFIDLRVPGDPEADQRYHYLRVIAFMRDLEIRGELADSVDLQRDNYMSWLTGFFIGFASQVASVGTERETAAKAIADWLELR